MLIKNVKVFCKDREFREDQIIMENGMFRAAAEQLDGETVDGEGCYAIPGLIDLHFHGCMGADFCDGTDEAIETIGAYQASVGVTSMCPATMTVPKEQLEKVMTAASAYRRSKGARLMGINMEGPFISAEKRGAQSKEQIIPCDEGFFQRLQRLSGGLIKLVDIAPETPGAMEFIDRVHDKAAIALAHTTADYKIAKQAFDHGARHVTHLYNAMLPFSHREPGVIGAAFDSTHSMVELICDGVHIHPAAVRATFAMFGDKRIVLISDSMRATGMPDGRYTLGGQEVDVSGKRAVLTAGGALAGSVTNLMECVKLAVQEMGIPLESAVACATINPAKVLGIYPECGSISPGKRADLVLLKEDLSLHSVWIGGKKCPTNENEVKLK